MASSLRRVEWHWAHLGLLAMLPVVAMLSANLRWAPTTTLSAWLLLNIVVLAAAERWMPFRDDWRPSRRHLLRDAFAWVLNLATDSIVTIALTVVAIAWRPGENDWPLAWQIIVGLLTGEFGSYWLHRWSHREGWLWRVHMLHHRPDRLNLANSVLAHPVNAAYDKAARLLPLLLLGLTPDALLMIALFGLTQSLVTHANVAGSIGPLDRLIGSAELHRLHHSTQESQAGNFGTALPLWDQVFGTYRRGAAPSTVGVFDPDAYPGEFELGRLLWWPFAWVRRVGSRVMRFDCCWNT